MFGQVAMSESQITPLDISSEQYRDYIYADGSKLRVDNPRQLFITESGSHRVIDQVGVVYRPERGYIGISWLPKNGSPLFVA